MKPIDWQTLTAEALMAELDTTPKPGLVDRNNNGSHRDMDYALMSKSIRAIAPYFAKMAEASRETLDVETLRAIGLEAERAMFETTRGVNTHKGAIFALGLLVASCSHLLATNGDGQPIQYGQLQQVIEDLAQQFQPQQNTNGVLASLRYRVQGALAMAQHGYDIVFNDLLPWYRKALKESPDENMARIRTLLYIMSRIEDTNLYHRGGEKIAMEIRRQAGELCRQDVSLEELTAFDARCISLNVSAGGSADILSMTILLDKLNNII